MPKYTVLGQRTSSTTLDVWSIVSPATVRRVKLAGFSFGSEATAADTAFNIAIQAITAAGTNTPYVPLATEAPSPAALSTAGVVHTVAATGTNQFMLPVNGRSTIAYWFRPGYELIGPATAASGWSMKTPVSTALQLVTSTAFYEE